jgi:exopolysaccharide biosynthesis polyprenyl glycosylphosphotransferase
MPTKHREIANQFSQFSDALLIALVYWLAHALRETVAYWFPPGSAVGGIEFGFSMIAPFRYYKWLYLVILPVCPLLLDFNGYYSRPIGLRRRQILWILTKSVAIAALLVVAVMYFFNIAALSRGVILLFAVLSIGVLFLKDQLALARRRHTARQADQAIACLLVGPPAKNAEFEALLDQHPEWRLKVFGHLDPTTESLAALPDRLHSEPIGCVIFNVTQTTFEDVQQAILACETEGVEAWLVADFVKTSIARATVDEFGGKPLLIFRSTPDTSWQLLAKRLLDVVGAGLGLLVLGPLVMVPAAVAIRLTSPGPILFRQRRSGLHGRQFTMYKFRSMVDNAEMLRVELEAFNEVSGPVFKMKRDPRVTKIGQFLRRTSIDELPQLWNVLNGDMSLVGPRPPIPSEVSKYDPWHRRRLSMKPGLTCLWQISGRSAIGFEQWIKLDLEYIDHWSLWLDLKILARTVPVVLGGFGAH